MPVIAAAAMSGAFSYLSFDHYFSYITSDGVTNWASPVAIKRAICVVVGFIVMKLLNLLEYKKGATWVREWGITVAMAEQGQHLRYDGRRRERRTSP